MLVKAFLIYTFDMPKGMLNVVMAQALIGANLVAWPLALSDHYAPSASNASVANCRLPQSTQATQSTSHGLDVVRGSRLADFGTGHRPAPRRAVSNPCVAYECTYQREEIWDVCAPWQVSCEGFFSQDEWAWRRTVVYYRCRKSQDTWVDRIWCPTAWARTMDCCTTTNTTLPGCTHNGKIECGQG